jgi:L-fucose mutarotase
MLIGLNPLLGPDLLYALRAMGHGDEIAIVDGNYPADAHGQRVIRADGHGVAALMEAILSVMPIDDKVEQAVFIPGIAEPQDCHATFTAIIKKHAPNIQVFGLKGEAFYDRVKSCYALVASSETALYGNIIIRKGVVYPK